MSTLTDKFSAARVDGRRVGPQLALAVPPPTSYDAITPEWLTQITCAGHPGAAVIRHEIEPLDPGSTNRCAIRLDYNQAGQDRGLPKSLFCKASHDPVAKTLHALTGCSRTEATFYNYIRPLLRVETPQCLFAWFDAESFDSLIVLEDLSDRISGFCDHDTTITRARVERQLALLAQIHGTCHRPDLQRPLRGLSSWPEFFRKMSVLDLEKRSNAGFLAARDAIPPRTWQSFNKVWPATVASADRHAQLPETLVHGDVHLRNWYLTREGDMGLSDWETASRGHWSRDVAHLISTVLTVESRRAWEKDLLRFYLDRFAAYGGPTVRFDDAWINYRQQLMSAFAWWTFTLSWRENTRDLRPGDSTLEFVHRAAVAVDDVDSLVSFEDIV